MIFQLIPLPPALYRNGLRRNGWRPKVTYPSRLTVPYQVVGLHQPALHQPRTSSWIKSNNSH